MLKLLYMYSLFDKIAQNSKRLLKAFLASCTKVKLIPSPGSHVNQQIRNLSNLGRGLSNEHLCQFISK